MLELSTKQMARNAEFLGIALSALRAARALIRERQFAQSLGRLYYCGYFCARAALVEWGDRSDKHKYWVARFNQAFGRGTGWVPSTYVKHLNELRDYRDALDYHGAVPNDRELASKYFRSMRLFLKKVRSNSPVCSYPQFIAQWVSEEGDEVEAIEFDFYCPKSYLHKERVQFQIQARKYTTRAFNGLVRAGRESLPRLRALRQDDYVLGWNNRMGQGGQLYLLFLDLDCPDIGAVKAALRDRKGWLFASGNGFHFIGARAVRGREAWIRELGGVSKSTRALLDERYEEFSIRRGYSTIRATTSPVKSFEPFLCWDNS